MKRTTHLTLGAAAGVLVAASVSLPVAAGAVWMGLAGGGFPDWLDLRSELRGSLRLRHRGASHGLPFAFAATLLIGTALRALSGETVVNAPSWLHIDRDTADLWTLAFALGILTHLLGDACTYAGIRPLLPFSQRKTWMLPKMLRSRSDGYLNGIAMLFGIAIIGLIVVWRIAIEIGAVGT